MKLLGATAALVLALVLQTTLAQLLVRGTAALDLVLVVVDLHRHFIGRRPPGLLAGAAAGLAQDALSSGILGSAGWRRPLSGS